MDATNSPEKLSGRSAEEVEELVVATEDLIDRVLSHLQGAGIRAEIEELRAFGRQGLVEAAARFDPSQGDDFRRFAYFRVKGAMLDGLRKMHSWSRRGYERVAMLRAAHMASEGLAHESSENSPESSSEAARKLQKHMASVVTAMTTGVFADHTLQGEGEVQALDRTDSVEERLAEQQMTRLVRDAIEELPPPEDEVIRRFYVEGEKMDLIARDLGHSRSWVSRVHTKALRRLGARLKHHS